MNIKAISNNYKPYFRALYTNPNGTKVNISEEAIAEMKTMAQIRKSVDEAYQNNPSDYYRYETNNDIASRGTKFLIDSKGKCIFVPSDFGRVAYVGETKFGIQNGSPWEIEAKKYISKQTSESFSDEGGLIRANGTGYKYAYIQPDYNVKVSHPEWAPKSQN